MTKYDRKNHVIYYWIRSPLPDRSVLRWMIIFLFYLTTNYHNFSTNIYHFNPLSDFSLYCTDIDHCFLKLQDRVLFELDKILYQRYLILHSRPSKDRNQGVSISTFPLISMTFVSFIVNPPYFYTLLTPRLLF